MAVTARPGAGLSAPLADPQLYAGDPWPVFARLRREAPVAWVVDGGYWAVTTHPEVLAMGADPDTFCSSRGILVEEIGNEYPAPPTMMHTDPPQHTTYRRTVQPGFKPSIVRDLEAPIRQRATTLVAALALDDPVDIVPTLCVPYPLQVIAELLGVSPDEWPRFFEWSEAVIPGATDWPEERRNQLMGEMVAYLLAVSKERRARPKGDVVSALATAAPEGHQLSDDELAMFLVQLLVAGNETTRNLLSGGLAALAEDPEQWRYLCEDPSRIPLAVEELLRWTTPVISFMRTATRRTEVRGVVIEAGEPVLLIYASANRDEAVFGPGADRLDVTRDPNPHVAFGFGPHFCLGAPLARLEARLMLEELTGRFDRLASGGPVVRAASPVIAGVKEAPLVLTAR